VRRFVATNDANPFVVSSTVTSNGYFTIRGTMVDTGDWYEARGEYPYNAAIVASNCTASAVNSGVTNGTLFAWDGLGHFWNGTACVNASSNCYVFSGVESTVTNGVDTFSGYFDFRRTAVTPSVASNLLSSATLQAANGRRMRMMIVDIFFPTAFAAGAGFLPGGDWSGFGKNWYSPPRNEATYVEPSFDDIEIFDKQGRKGTIELDLDGYNISKPNEWTDMNTKGVLDAVCQVAARVYENANDINYLKLSFEMIAKRLDNAFKNVADRLKKLEEQKESPDDSGTTITEEYNTYINNEGNKITIIGGTAALKVDNRSIAVKNTGKKDAAYTLKGFPGVGTSAGKIPFFGGVNLEWIDPETRFDGDSITARTANGKYHTIDEKGISLAGWGSPSANPHKCLETIASNLTNLINNSDHYVLTRYEPAGGDAKLHYMRIGSLHDIADGGSALRV